VVGGPENYLSFISCHEQSLADMESGVDPCCIVMVMVRGTPSGLNDSWGQWVLEISVYIRRELKTPDNNPLCSINTFDNPQQFDNILTGLVFIAGPANGVSQVHGELLLYILVP